METRKVQQVGGGTYTVSLPKEWAEREGVTAGTEVALYAHIDGTLAVRAGDRERAPDGPIAVPVDDDPGAVERVVRAGYAAGSTELRLDSPGGLSAEQERALQRVGRGLTGVAIGESEDGATVRTLVDPGEVSVRQSVRQLQYVALSMHRDALAALDGAGMADPGDRDDQADRLYALVERHLTRGLARLGEVDALGLDRSELFELWATARELERVADHAERVARTAAELDAGGGGPVGDIDDLACGARAVVEDAVGLVVDGRGLEAAHEVLRARDRVRDEGEALDRRLFEAEGVDYRLTRVLDSVVRTAEHGGNIAEVGLQRALRRERADAPAPST
ncbi:phosphate uptake regulator PhoU [Salinirussus salinus]|jgi:phosphate uptake regulator|uniref:phosphate uptake regulator PhoU n=1 Tax=Salinirussus salinus TaxID=1198300 RepID=UPI00135774D6|nr:phosphate uptake regulator PhoU [Salinirussus salinus]